MSVTADLVDQMTLWRRQLHAHPEFGFDERTTSAFVAALLRSFGFEEVAEGIGGTGVVGTLRRGPGNRSIGLRAEMDALQIHEARGRPYCSTRDGLMHACGHDGHTAMLLGAAKCLAEEGGFSGTVQFIFQPAEEWGKGAEAMIDDGLLDRFPVAEIFALHNWPGLEVGRIATRPGALMAAEDNFEITVRGEGGHAARPHAAREALVAGCAIVTALQTIVSRVMNPASTAVVSATEFETDGTRNVLPAMVRIRGDCRSFSPDESRAIEASMGRIAKGVAAAHGCVAELVYERSFIPVINDPEATQAAVRAALAVNGPDAVDACFEPVAASEDFARFLEKVPGCFLFLGNGADSAPLHNHAFDFNDEALATGAGLHIELARSRLPA